MLNKYLNRYQQTPGRHCIAIAVASFLKFQGWYDLSEELAWLLLGRGVALKYFPPMLASLQDLRISTGGSGQLEANARQNLGLEIVRCTERDPKAAWRVTQSCIEQELPQLIEIDIFYLDFFRHYYRKWHGWHLLTITGYADASASVSDGDWQGLVPKADLLQARGSTFARDGGLDYAWWKIERLATRQLNKELLRTNLRVIVQEALTNAVLEKQVYLGPQAGELFLRDLAQWTELDDAPLRFTVMEKLFHELSRPEGPAYCYILLARLLERLDEDHDRAYREFAQIFLQLAKQWKLMAALLMKGNLTKSLNTLGEIHTKLAAVLEQTNIAFVQLESVLRSA